MEQPLNGRIILVTGVSREKGIGAAIARDLVSSGAKVVIHGYAGYDREMAYDDACPDYAGSLAETLRREGGCIQSIPASDFSQPGAGQQAVEQAAQCFGPLNGMVLNHAYSVSQPIGQWTEAQIQKHLTVNVLAEMMMVQAFALQLPKGQRGAVTLFTSGQYLGPMVGEIAYAVSKEAIAGLCQQAAAALAPQNIQVNCINPGPTDTGWAASQVYSTLAQYFPLGRWGTPEDAARLVHFLQSEDSRWITGQVIASEGGFQRSR